MKPYAALRRTPLGTTPSGKTVYLEKLPHDYPRFSKSDHLYAAVLHEANRTPGRRADLHRESALMPAALRASLKTS